MDRIINERIERDAEAVGDGSSVRTLLVQSNKEASTYDGIDWGGERVADEVQEEIERLAGEGTKVTKLSVVGYSLGGLVGRYLLGVLHQRDLFKTITPVNFFTVATPHLGIINYPTFRSRMFAFFGQNLLSRTGEQFYSIDKWSAKGRPLLEVMADPQRVFYQALALFPNICFYANAVNDVTVPYLTSAVESEDPFMDHKLNGLTVDLDEKYSPIIASYNLPTVRPPPPPSPKIFTHEWLQSMQPQINLPPRFNKGFPYNIGIYLSLPVLMPALLVMIAIRLGLDSRSSRGRIKLLESEESYRARLVHIVGQLEKQMEDVVVDYMDDPDPLVARSADATVPAGSSSSTTLADPEQGAEIVPTPKWKKEKGKGKSKGKAKLSDVQLVMIKNLNTLPNLRKKLAFIHPVMNAHAVIIARDVKRFPHHNEGHGVLKHLADGLIL